MNFYEIEDGVWVAPDLVAGVRVHPLYNGMAYEGFCVEMLIVGGGVIRCNETSTFRMPVEDRPPGVHTAEQWIAYGRADASGVVAWLNERRSNEPIVYVRQA